MNERPATVGRRLLSGSVLRVGNLMAAAVASLFLMPFIVHHLGDRVYGFWSLAAALIGYYDLLDFGLSSAISQYLSIAIGRSDPAECRAVFNAALRIQSLLGSVALFATGAIAIVTPRFCHNPADASVFWRVIVVLGISAALSFPARVYGAVLGAEFRFDIQAGVAIVGVALRTGLIFWAIAAGYGLVALTWATLIANLPVIVLEIYFARREALWARIERSCLEARRVKALFSYSIYIFFSYLADILRFQIDPVVISSLIGVAAVTHYRVAAGFTQYYLQILIVSVGMLHPVLSRFYGAGNQAGLEKLFFLGMKISCCISVFVCLALICWGKPFITLWMGPQYNDAYLPLVMLSLAVFLDVSQKPSIDLLYATFKHRFYTYTNWSEGIINLACSLALAPRLGILGVAMGTLIAAFFIRVVLQPWWVCRVNGLNYASYMRFFGGNLLLCGVLMTGATIISSWGLRPSYIHLIGSAICVTAIYAAACLWMFFNRGEREHFWTAIMDRVQIGDREAAAAALES
jgi:O-antigen/teichoic acid export membrane protein